MRTFIIFVTLFLLNPFIISAQSGNSETQININHIAIAVTDLEESEIFYRDVIGLKQIPEPFGLGMHAWFQIGESQLHIIRGATERKERNKYNHLCFSVTDLDQFIDRLELHGVQFSDWDLNPGEITIRVDGVQQIYFTDPDGYWIEVNDET